MNIENHPCFNPGACKDFGRVHLPVAPRCNIQCNFCNRKFDCVNESRPGVSSALLKSAQAMNYLADVIREKPNISVVGIAGPGDPFANPEETLTTLELVRQKYPDMLLCVATNGLNLPEYLDELKRLGVSHVSITVNAVDVEIGKQIYSWIRYGKKTLSADKGAEILLEKQFESIAGLKERGMMVKVNTIVLPGINDHHVVDIARTMEKCGVDLFNCMPYFPNQGSNFADLKEPSEEMIADIRKKAGAYIPQMLHCSRCRADAVGHLDEENDDDLMGRLMFHASANCKEDKLKTDVNKKGRLIAAATREGVLVNQHLGEAETLNIYDASMEEPVLVEIRRTPEAGGKDLRWHALSDTISDCSHLLVSGVGGAPKEILSQKGIEVLEVNGIIHEIIHAVKNNKPLNHLMVREHYGCGESCRGTGMGCM